MTELQQNRYDALMRRVGDLKGPGSKVNDVLEELFPTLDVENVPGELLYLMGTRIAYGGNFVAGVAAQFSTVQVFNPAASGKLLTVTRMIVSADADTPITWDVNATPLTLASNNERVRDTRSSTDELPVGQIRTLSSVTQVTTTGILNLLALTPFTLEDVNGIAVLAPGSGLRVGVSTANITMRATFYWRERIAEPSELNF